MEELKSLVNKNSIIKLYDGKRGKIYILDCTSEKIYVANINFNFVSMGTIGGGVGLVSHHLLNQHLEISLANLPHNLVNTIFIGGFVFIAIYVHLYNKSANSYSLEEYSNKYEGLREAVKDERKRIVKRATQIMILFVLGTLFLLIFSIYAISAFFFSQLLSHFIMSKLAFFALSMTVSNMRKVIIFSEIDQVIKY